MLVSIKYSSIQITEITNPSYTEIKNIKHLFYLQLLTNSSWNTLQYLNG